MKRPKTKERKLKSRRRKFPVGYVIRVSNPVYEVLTAAKRDRSWDWLFRRMLGIPDRAGTEQPLIEGMLETTTGRFLLKTEERSWERLEEDAYEIAILTAAARKTKRVNRPIRMKEHFA